MRYETVLAELGRLRHGIIRVEDAVAAGVSMSALRNLRRRRGVLVPAGRGVTRLRDPPFAIDCSLHAQVDLAGSSGERAVGNEWLRNSRCRWDRDRKKKRKKIQ